METSDDLQAIATGNRAAFARLYNIQQPAMIRYASGILAGDIEAAADVVDEAFLTIWTSAGKWSGEGSAEGWIRRIVRNKAVDWIRKSKEKTLRSNETDRPEQIDSSDTPETLSIKYSNANALHDAMADLSPEHYDVIWMLYFEDKSITEIAEITGLASGTVKSRAFHARKKLNIALAARGLP